MKTEQRTSWIDVLKGLGIILVVIGHVNTKGFLVQWIYTFHMPLFFALSGYILKKFGKRSSFKAFFLKRSKTILWPFVLFRILLFTYWVLIESHFRSFDIGPIWFLIVLYILELIAYPIFNHNSNRFLWIFSVDGLIAAVWLGLSFILPVCFYTIWLLRIIDGLVWYILGYVWGIVECEIKKITLTNSWKKFLISGFLVISIMIGYFNPGVSMWSNSYGKSYVIYIFGGIIGSLWLGFVCKWFIVKNSFLEYLGQNTITILAVHEPIKRIILKLTEIIMQHFGVAITVGMLQNNVFYALIIVAVVVAISFTVICCLKQLKAYMPIKIRNNFMAFVR